MLTFVQLKERTGGSQAYSPYYASLAVGAKCGLYSLCLFTSLSSLYLNQINKAIIDGKQWELGSPL
jgi:hypothetical protein